MPHITFKNLKKEEVKYLSCKMTDKLSDLMKCDKDWIYYNHIKNDCFVMGEEYTEKCIYVKIGWFSRGDETKVEVAKYITTILKEKYPDRLEIIVVFEDYDKLNYFENGERF